MRPYVLGHCCSRLALLPLEWPSLGGHPQDPVTGVVLGERQQMPAATVTVCLFWALPQMPDSGTMTSLAASLWPTELIIIYCSRLLGVIGSESRCMHAFSGRGGPSREGHPQGPVTGADQGERPQMPAAAVTVCSVSALPLPPASGRASVA